MIKRSRQYWFDEDRDQVMWMDVELAVMTHLTPPMFRMHGETGCVVTDETATEMTLDYWRTFLEDDPHELGNLVSHMTIETLAELGEPEDSVIEAVAKHVTYINDAYHGLDVQDTCGHTVLLSEGWGQLCELKYQAPWVMRFQRYQGKELPQDVRDLFESFQPLPDLCLEDLNMECDWPITAVMLQQAMMISIWTEKSPWALLNELYMKGSCCDQAFKIENDVFFAAQELPGDRPWNHQYQYSQLIEEWEFNVG